MGGISARNRHMQHFRVDDTRTIVTTQLGGGGSVGISRVRCDFDGLGMVADHELEEAFLISLQLQRMQAELWLDGRHVPVPGRSDGRTTIHDLRWRWHADFHTRFDSVNFHVPRIVFEGLAPDPRGREVTRLNATPGDCIDDDVVRGLALALLSALAAPEQANALFVDHVGCALAAHIADAYGEALRTVVPGKGRLAGWQERRAKEMIDANLNGDIRLEALAAACRLSVGHFARAFRKTTGLPPHRWLMRRRIERAKDLLQRTRLSIADVALQCGFSDQSHLTRVFERMAGTTPAVWRREYRPF
ncbi:MAG: transcriptional regulator [Rhodospirillales bacterium]|jgi:AraC family transcriptional regulator|nr:transcriptional regulator [Rhodospirillales bacterium]